ncbi:hypothetical protein G3T14_23285 [Methylobacterium sp. BTF04]|uniref:hypothetical protein n=1 Tax=Methylobacterium sp. BTF04 TaxID=2708300 RepID=UPI0013D0657E|nr:hypothetical protein [Methylobacterium sp. BTF04]NEU14972.1 hypothetical protein [Methylobacterium sp. BTF04]
MSNYVAMVFKADPKAHEALRKLWDMDAAGDVTVHGAAIVRRDRWGHMNVASESNDAGMRTAIGVGVGMLLGALAGPAGAVAGALAAETAVGIGALAGGAIGLTADAFKSEERDELGLAAFYNLSNGESAVVADVSEDWPDKLDDAAKALGGTIYRKYDAISYPDKYDRPFYNNYLYPYYYDPLYC